MNESKSLFKFRSSFKFLYFHIIFILLFIIINTEKNLTGEGFSLQAAQYKFYFNYINNSITLFYTNMLK